MKKKILITEFYNYSPILETGLELALKNLFKNNIVHDYFLGHSVQNDAGMIWPRIKDKIYLIQLMRQLNSYSKKRHNLIFLKELGYEFNLELSSKYITIYINKFKNKIIVNFEGADGNFLKNLYSYNMPPVIEEFIDYKKNVISFFEEINKTYNDYKAFKY